MYRSYRNDVDRELDRKIKKTLTGAGIFLVGRMKRYVAVDTARLKGSLQYDVDKNELRFGSGGVGQEVVNYATFQERSQPFIKPSVFDNQNALKRLMKQLFKEG